MKHVLSLGAGVQSSTLLLMSCRGDLPKLDAAIFADTGWEPPGVYAHLEFLKSEAAQAGIPIHVVKAGNIREDALQSQVRGKKGEGRRWASMPFFTYLAGGKREGKIRRQCTSEYKLEPIERFVKREILGFQPRQRLPKVPLVQQWVGFSGDELHRVRIVPPTWTQVVYPLIYWLDPAFKRQDCRRWFAERYPGRTLPRSACVGCPMHSNFEWREMRDARPEEWADAVAFDKAIRKLGGMRADVFLHRSCRPLDEAPIDDGLAGQEAFWGRESCMGNCGV